MLPCLGGPSYPLRTSDPFRPSDALQPSHTLGPLIPCRPLISGGPLMPWGLLMPRMLTAAFSTLGGAFHSSSAASDGGLQQQDPPCIAGPVEMQGWLVLQVADTRLPEQHLQCGQRG